MTLKMVWCCLLLTSYLHSWNFTPSDLEEFSVYIWQQECRGSVEGLVLWDPEDSFVSLGVGHLAWYPKEVHPKQKTQFYHFIQFIKDHSPSTTIPTWITPTSPWSSQKEFLSKIGTPQVNELRNFLLKTLSLQIQFLFHQFTNTESQLIAENPEVQDKLFWLKKSKAGHLAIMDYCTFQGSGLAANKRLHCPLGLLQVLQAMGNIDSPEAALTQFILQAKKSLQKKTTSFSLTSQKSSTQKWNTRLNHYLDLNTQPAP